MMTFDWSHCPVVEAASGGLVFRGTHTPVSRLFERFKAGASINEIENQLGIARKEIEGVLDFVARSLASPGAGHEASEREGSTKVHGDKIDITAGER